MKGKLIVLYGINNLGKTTQAKMLADRLRRDGHKTEYIKYPVYALAPSGPLLNEYLRKGNPHTLNARELQLLYAFNRAQYEPALRATLANGTHVVAEDYYGTGIAWGEGYGVDGQFLREINSAFIKEDIALFLHGKRFTFAIEKNHTHEEDAALVERVRTAHERLAKEYHWTPVEVTDGKEKVHEKIWNVTKKLL
ncbi:hypothetical protein HY625_02045 [Candidatus Uhrbacteria bacterium]|nr:hypothetical protein [Candidatus Uhrbacteria bacterium]